MIYADFARPAPPSEIVKRLKQVDDRLDLTYISYPHRDGPNVNITQYWAITQRWRQDDKRRQMIQLGQMAESSDFDVLAKLPIDCSVEEAHDYFLRALKGKIETHGDVKRVLERLHKYNEAQKVENLKETTELAEELIESNVGTLFEKEGKKIPKVFLAQGNQKK